MTDPRLIMYHKHPTSARTRFLRLDYGGVCGFTALPDAAELAEKRIDDSNLVSHPAFLIRDAETRLGLPSGSLEAESGYRCKVSCPEGAKEVFLARFTSIDPPFDEAEAQGASFIDLTQARGLPKVELALLRLAYEKILG
ncbi:hypothetical protein G3480_17795 [Thiorhodococcus mannitoliphagus]|uniref:Uncharacterized protein n=1 Tax=Thiorhodococcus mannitoliphagus TaxID=329406 RepID=A0A6P1E372_9GAMM|nr:hypothetical protein [Thiorhodococcus mannitoliphagus]NEX22135.1 hypothetical protein [Thiorhodococcus mannitoliphagus]